MYSWRRKVYGTILNTDRKKVTFNRKHSLYRTFRLFKIHPSIIKDFQKF
jgi:hypothetical protein